MDFKKQKGSQVTYIETVNTSGLSLNASYQPGKQICS